MSIKNGTTLTTDALSYLVGLIKDISGLDTKLIDNINLKDNGTFSSTKIDSLLRILKEECNEYSENLCSNLSRLELKLVTSETEITQSNILYLFKPDGQTSYNQYVVIDGNKVLLGTCDISMTDYYTITQADDKFVLKTDYNDLVDTVNTINDTIGDKTKLNSTICDDIEELKNKSNIETVTKAQYEELKTNGTVTLDGGKILTYSDDTYYIISDDGDNLDLNKFNIKTYNSLSQLGIIAPTTVGEIFNATPIGSMCRILGSTTENLDYTITDIPAPQGILIIDKVASKSFDIEFKLSTQGSVSGNNKWIGQLKGSDGTGLTWNRLCTTKVSDTDLITSLTYNEDAATYYTLTNNGLHSHYIVKNGICYVDIDVTCVSTRTNNWAYVLTGLPMPTSEHVRYFSMGGEDGKSNINGIMDIQGRIGLMFGNPGIRYVTSFSYPVAES